MQGFGGAAPKCKGLDVQPPRCKGFGGRNLQVQRFEGAATKMQRDWEAQPPKMHEAQDAHPSGMQRVRVASSPVYIRGVRWAAPPKVASIMPSTVSTSFSIINS